MVDLRPSMEKDGKDSPQEISMGGDIVLPNGKEPLFVKESMYRRAILNKQDSSFACA